MDLDYSPIQEAIDDTTEELAAANEDLRNSLYAGEGEAIAAIDEACSAYDGAEGVAEYAFNVPPDYEVNKKGNEGIFSVKPDRSDLMEEIDQFMDLYEQALDIHGPGIPEPRSFQNSGVEEAIDRVSEGEITVDEAVEKTIGA